jgi:tetratricopeptide (TPR) repeat protein
MGDIERLVADADDGTVDEEFLRHLFRGGELLTGGLVDQAREALEKAYALQPENPKAQNLLGLTYFKLGVFDKAAEIYEILVRDNPVDPTLRVNLGLVYLKENALSRATREFEAAVDLSPDHKKAQNYLGLAYAQTGDYARAKDCFVAAGSLTMAEKMEKALREPATAAQLAEDAQAPEKGAEEVTGALSSEPPLDSHGDPGAQSSAPSQDADAERLSVPAPSEAPVGGAPPVEVSWDQEVLRTSPRLPADVPAGPASPNEPLSVPEPVEAPVGEAESEGDSGRVASAESDVFTAAPAKPLPEATETPASLPEEAPPPEEAVAAPQPVAAPDAWTQPQAALAAPSLAELTRALAMVPPEGGEPFEATSEIVVVRVEGEILTRLEGLLAATGGLSYLPEMKRFRGRATDKAFGDGERRMVRASGRGTLVLSARERVFVPVELANESAYFREDAVFAFEEAVIFENGRVPSKIAPDLHLVHLRGQGRVLLCSSGLVRSVPIAAGAPVVVPMGVLLGWHGQVTPRIIGLPEEREVGAALPAVELSGGGFALLASPRALSGVAS